MQNYKLDNLSNMKATVAKLTDDIDEKYHLSEEKFFDVRLVLSELLVNAFKHSKTDVFVDIFLDNDFSEDEIKITVEDYGRGFDTNKINGMFETNDLMSGSGRGIRLVSALCEKVTYNDVGNSVSIVMKV